MAVNEWMLPPEVGKRVIGCEGPVNTSSCTKRALPDVPATSGAPPSQSYARRYIDPYNSFDITTMPGWSCSGMTAEVGRQNTAMVKLSHSWTCRYLMGGLKRDACENWLEKTFRRPKKPNPHCVSSRGTSIPRSFAVSVSITARTSQSPSALGVFEPRNTRLHTWYSFWTRHSAMLGFKPRPASKGIKQRTSQTHKRYYLVQVHIDTKA
mmetsp:Transcript_5478/g.9462  ORF Transcript_5478/g.9462 Transcript_5478/m.9462 type:complete len:209 (-) Transcript_5478:286-912(-)